VRLGHIIHHKLIYPGETVPSLASIASQIPTRLGLEYFSMFKAYLHLDPKAKDAQVTCLEEFYGIKKIDLLQRVLQAANMQKKTYGRFYLFDHYTSLVAIDALLKNYNDFDPGNARAEEDQQIAMLKLLLVANQTLEDEFKISKTSDSDLKVAFYKSVWPNSLHTSDHRVRADFVVHSYKGVKFIEYILGKPDYNEQFNKYFLEADGLTPMAYISTLVSIYVVNAQDKERQALHHAFNIDVETLVPTVAKFVIHLDKLSEEKYNGDDFRTLRGKPLVKIRESRYDMTNWNFWLEKMSRGMRFDLFERTDLREKYKGRLDTFLGQIGEEFGEDFFGEIFKELMVEHKDVFIRGVRSDQVKNIDFYFRRHSKVLLFECKDALLVKHKNYDKLKAHIDSKLNQRDKGTGQLFSQLEKIKENINIYEELSKRTKLNKHVFYPIIIVTDIGYTLAGVSQYLEDEFEKLIAGKTFPFKVKPLTVVCFDFFLENYDDFKAGKLDFLDALDYYIKINSKRRHEARTATRLTDIQPMMEGFNETVFKFLSTKLRIGGLGFLGQYVANKLQLKDK